MPHNVAFRFCVVYEALSCVLLLAMHIYQYPSCLFLFRQTGELPDCCCQNLMSAIDKAKFSPLHCYGSEVMAYTCIIHSFSQGMWYICAWSEGFCSKCVLSKNGLLWQGRWLFDPCTVLQCTCSQILTVWREGERKRNRNRKIKREKERERERKRKRERERWKDGK